MLNINELRKMDMKELKEKFAALDREIAMDTFDIEARKTNKTGQLRSKKKDRSRIATVITELYTLQTVHEQAN